jgi:hypothetical protein
MEKIKRARSDNIKSTGKRYLRTGGDGEIVR